MSYTPKEFKLVSLRDCPLPNAMPLTDDPDKVAAYWREHITKHPSFSPEVECFCVLFLNSRRRATGHILVSTGVLDQVLVHPREVFRAAIVANSSAIICMHNHPSGDSTPSDADVKVTRELIRAGQLLKIDLLDHVIVGNGQHTSLRSCGYFTL